MYTAEIPIQAASSPTELANHLPPADNKTVIVLSEPSH